MKYNKVTRSKNGWYTLLALDWGTNLQKFVAVKIPIE